jgi:hypothetical protein
VSNGERETDDENAESAKQPEAVSDISRQKKKNALIADQINAADLKGIIPEILQ